MNSMSRYAGVLRPVRIVDPNNAAVAVEPIGDESIPVMWDLVEPENTFAHLDTEVFVRHCPGADGHGVFDSEGHLMNWWATLIPNAGGVVSLRSGFPAPGVRGHVKVPTGGRVEVPTGGQLEVPTSRSSCRAES